MRFNAKLSFAALTAALVLAAAVGAASANRLSISERNFTSVWTVPLSGSGGGEITAECPVTINGSFHSASFAKVREGLVGHIYRAAVGSPCVSGGMTVLTETLPWHVTYEAFRGVLPRITGVAVRLIGASFRVTENFGVNVCLFRTTATNPGKMIMELNETGAIIGLRADESTTIPMTGPFPCELTENASIFRGTANMTNAAGRQMTIRLI